MIIMNPFLLYFALLIFSLWNNGDTLAFSPSRPRAGNARTTPLRSIAVPISELEKDLTPAEKSITSVVRTCGPSVAYVTSVWPEPATTPVRGRGRNRRRQSNSNSNNNLPEGMDLGSGSGFQVSSDGYLCTNYHVIERAYTIQQASQNVDHLLNQIAGNATNWFPKDIVHTTKSKIQKLLTDDEQLPIVFVRINSETNYKACRIVDVVPELDLAVLKGIHDSNETVNDDDAVTNGSVDFGSSSDLLVGQTVVAIGNPFALDKTVTTGVVSAVNREYRAGTARTPTLRPIRNCIQTDAAINPGNSGGPLLNLKGEVVGINTAIITTSGSNAGIGFAVPSDQVQPHVQRIIQQDRIQNGQRRNKGWLGVSIIKNNNSYDSTISNKNWVVSVDPGSPADLAGIRSLTIFKTGTVEWGDAIVAVAGNEVTTFDEVLSELEDRVKGEEVPLTLEDYDGKRRVVYVKLSQKPE